MNKIILLLAACLMISLHSNAQWYSKYFGKTDLRDHTMDELNLLIKYPEGLRNFGYVMITGGIVLTSVGFVIFASTFSILPWDDSGYSNFWRSGLLSPKKGFCY